MQKRKEKNNSNPKWREILFGFHVYGGLFITGYLIIIGISSLHYQHHFNLPSANKKKQWEQTIKVPHIENNLEFKMAVRDSLRLFGYTPWWEDNIDENGIHRFMITRPGKNYWVEVPLKGDVYKIEESGTGFLNVMMQLHGLTGGALKGPEFIRGWKFLAQIMNLIFLLVLLLTLYFWYKRSFSSARQSFIALAFAFVPILILVFIWLVG